MRRAFCRAFRLSLPQLKFGNVFLRNPDTLVLARKYNLTKFALSSLDTQALLVSLAKTAHAYLVAEKGLDGFIPLLPNLFLTPRNHPWFRYYIGGQLDAEPDGETLHEIAIETPTKENWRYYVVRVRFFSALGGPTYRIVAGERINPTKPEEVLLEEINALRNGQKMPVADPIVHPIPAGLWNLNTPFANEAPEPALKRFLRFSTKD